jgi:hypothetical protein
MKYTDRKDQFPLCHADTFDVKFPGPVIAWHYVLLIRGVAVL